jgi:electron transport complex protein RnfE
MNTFNRGVLANNPAWTQLLGLCPLLAVSNSVVNALGLALASGFVLLGSNLTISLLRHRIPDVARLPCFVLIIATFTTITVMILEAFAFTLYLRIALFVQIIVTNCMILGRAESFASRQPVGVAVLDALGTAVGFALALLILGSVRELLGYGTLLREMDLLFGETARSWIIELSSTAIVPLALFPPGAFLLAGLLFALAQGLATSRPSATHKPSGQVDATVDYEK